MGIFLLVWYSQHSFCLVSNQCLMSCRFEARRWPYKCEMWWSHVKASQFARKAFSCLYMGLIVVRMNIRNEMKTNTTFHTPSCTRRMTVQHTATPHTPPRYKNRRKWNTNISNGRTIRGQYRRWQISVPVSGQWGVNTTEPSFSNSSQAITNVR